MIGVRPVKTNLRLHGPLVATTFALFLCTTARDTRAQADPQITPKELHLLVGPEPSVINGVDHRFRVTVPTSYMPDAFVESVVPQQAISRAVFVATLHDFSPAGDRRADGPGLISGGISWIADDYVKSAVLDSRLSHFSQYNVPAPDEFGLKVRRTETYRWLPARLLTEVAGDEYTMIECEYLPAPDRPQFCQMWNQEQGQPLLELFFRETDLPEWKRMRNGAKRLMNSWIQTK